MIRHAGSMAVRVAALGLSLLLVLAFAFAVLLSRGPISLGFLTPYIQDMVNEAAAPLRVEIADTLLTWEGWDRQLDVRVVGVRIVDPRDHASATISEASVDLDPQALLAGKLRPSELELIGPSLFLVRQADGRFSFDVGGQNGEDNSGLEAIALMLVEDEQPAFLRSLRRLEVVGARLTVVDRQSGAVWRVPHVDVVLTRIPEGVRAVLTADVRVGDHPAFLNVGASWRGAEAPSEVTIDFADVNLAAFAATFPVPELEPLRGLDLATSGRLTLRFSDSRALQVADFDLSAGPGIVTAPGVLAEPLAIAGVTAAGRFETSVRTLVVDDFQLDLGDGLQVQASGALWREAGRLGAAARASLASLTMPDLERYWPEDQERNARRWIMENVLAGTITDVKLRVDIAPGDLELPTPPADMVVLDFRFHDAEARYWRPLPPIVDGVGSARLDLDTFTLQLESGQVGEIALADGKVRIGDLRTRDEVADIRFRATAPARAALQLLDREPLRFATKVGIDAEAVSGRSVTEAHFRIPLERDIRLDDVGYEATAQLDAFAMPQIFDLYAVSNGDLTLSVDDGGFDAEGHVALNGVPVDMSWRRDFEPAPGAPASRYSLYAVLDNAQRNALGLHLDEYFGGPVPVHLSMTVGRDERLAAQGEADLRNARLGFAPLDIGKKPGVPGTLDFDFRVDEGGILNVDRITIRAEGLNLDGSLALDGTGQLRRLTIERLWDGTNDFGAAMTVAPGGGFEVQVTGRSVDLRPVLAETESGGGSGPGGEKPPPLRLTAAVDRVLLIDDLALASVEARARADEGDWSHISATGLLNGAASVTALLETPAGAGERTLTIASDDAGAVLRAAGLVEQAEGGRLLLTATLPRPAKGPDGVRTAAAPVSGRLLMEGFRVGNLPVLARILTLGSLTGIGNLLSGEGIHFAVLDIPFTVTGAEVRIVDGRAVGSQLGLTANGAIDRRNRTVKLDGTLVPAYTLNSVLGHIPVIGNLFVGRPGEGVFAISYNVRGPVASPEVSVNPLTALAPGFLRRIVEGIANAGPPAAGQKQAGPDVPPPQPGGR